MIMEHSVFDFGSQNVDQLKEKGDHSHQKELSSVISPRQTLKVNMRLAHYI
jgi:hypothetical protein